MSLPDGARECEWCDSPCYGILCRSCDAAIKVAEKQTGITVYEIRRHSVWGVQLLVQWPSGKKAHLAPWTFVKFGNDLAAERSTRPADSERSE
mgnify:CR=1 FL=1